MNNPSIRTSLGIIICSLLIGCKPVEEVIPEPEIPVWISHPEVRLDRRLQIQAHATDDRLWLMGNNYLLSLDADHRLLSEELVAPVGNDLWNRSFLSDNLFATELKGQQAFELRRNSDPEEKITVDLRSLDSSVYAVNSYYNPPMAINSRGQILVGGRYDARAFPGITGFPIFILQTEQNDSLSVTEVQQRHINKGIFNYANDNRLNGIYAFGDTFYFSNSNYRFYQLIPNKEPELLFQMSLAHMLQVHDTLMAIGNQDSNRMGWYFRKRGQDNWQMRTFGALDNGFMRFSVIEDRIVAFRSGQLWELSLNQDLSSLEIRELNNLGLEQLTIHDVKEFRGRVYLCTNRGLYFQPLPDFFTDKSPE